MANAPALTLFHCPMTRSSGVLHALEELGAPYDIRLLDMRKNEQRGDEYLKVNPMGKVPALLHGDVLVTEAPAIYLYLGELFPEAKLAPQVGDPLRGPYLRWMIFYGSCFEPAVLDRAENRPPMPQGRSGYGDYDTTLKTVTDQLAKAPYLLGEQFTIADVLWGGALAWTTMFQLVPDLPVIKSYVERTTNRPAAVRARAKDAELAAAQTS